ncbi:hypothetical protein, partial [Plasmodium yoelii yoelii]
YPTLAIKYIMQSYNIATFITYERIRHRYYNL